MDLTDPKGEAENGTPPPFPTLPGLAESLNLDREELLCSSTEPRANDKLYTFLLQCARANIADVCKELGVPRWGGKEAMVDRLYTHLLRNSRSRGQSTEQEFGRFPITRARTKKGRSMSEFLCDQEDSSNAYFVPWSRAPSHEEEEEAHRERTASAFPSSKNSLREREESTLSGAPQISDPTAKFSEVCEHEEDARVQSASLPEFSRLIAILSYDDDVRNALVESALERTRQQLDARVPRDEFWDALVAPKFNCPDTDTLFRGIPCATDVYGISKAGAEKGICLKPKCYRSGSELKRWYWDTRSAFTVAHDRWSRSGQNDPDSFHKFVPTTSNGTITAVGKRLLIIFQTMKVGTDDELGDLLSFTLRTVPDEMGFDSMAFRAEASTDLNGSEGMKPGKNDIRSRKRRKLSKSVESTSR
jgi:hypothetical protein